MAQCCAPFWLPRAWNGCPMRFSFFAWSSPFHAVWERWSPHHPQVCHIWSGKSKCIYLNLSALLFSYTVHRRYTVISIFLSTNISRYYIYSLCISLYLSLYISITLFLYYLFISFSISLYPYLFLYLYIYIHISISLFLYFSISLFILIFLYLYLFIFIFLYIHTILYLSLYLYTSIYPYRFLSYYI